MVAATKALLCNFRGASRGSLRNVVSMLVACALLSCAAASRRPTAAAKDSEPALSGVLVEMLLTYASQEEQRQWAGKTFEHIASPGVLQSRPVSSPHVLAKRGKPAVLRLGKSSEDRASPLPIRYEVLVRGDGADVIDAPEQHAQRAGKRLSLDVSMQLENDDIAHASRTLEPQQVAVVPLQNGLTMVVRCHVINGREDMLRIYTRRQEARE